MATFYGTQAPDTLNGTQFDDTFKSGDGDDTLYGFAGNDIFLGGVGADTMVGGRDNDTYHVDNAGDRVVEEAGEGIDHVISTISYSLGTSYGTVAPPVSYGAVENLTLALGAGSINGTGNALNNVITGNEGDNQLDGGGSDAAGGFDTLIGGSGNDTFRGYGAQHMYGGRDNDTYSVDSVGDRVVELAGEGYDTVLVMNMSRYVMPENVEAAFVGGYIGSEIIGNGLDNHIVGRQSADTLDGALGADTMEGGGSSDIYLVDNTGDRVIETGNFEGGRYESLADEIRTTVSYDLPDFIENLTLLSAGGAIDGRGNALDNTLLGNEFSNILKAGDGNDVINGDIVNRLFKTASDTMVGGKGDDTYMVAHAQDIVTELAGEGVDTIHANLSFALPDNVENLTLGRRGTAATGNALSNRIEGNGLDNTIDGRGGVDTMLGGTGNDTYFVDNFGDTVIELTNEGVDEVISSVNIGLAANVENLTLTGTAWKGIGNELDNRINGTGAANLLNGREGADTITGGRGADLLTGGEGGDTFKFAFGDGADTILDFEAGGAGDDVIVIEGYGITDFGMLQKFMGQVGEAVVIKFGDGNAIQLNGVSLAELNHSDFLLLA